MTDAEQAALQRESAAPENGEVTIHKTCCGICNAYSHCGIDAYVQNGRIIRAEGSVDNPHSQGKLCPGAQASGSMSTTRSGSSTL